MNSRLTPVERLRRSGIAPERTLGQNFLIDPNILGVIARAASLGPDDVVLEVGPGLGVLTALLVEKCAAVHCIEVDRRLAGPLKEEFSGNPGFRLHLADAARFDLSRLRPPPGKFVSNLPYNVATPLVMKSLRETPSVGLWCLMVQKEIADRLFARAGTANYGGVSVMTQLLTEKVSARPVSAKVFYPAPRVRSSLLVFTRRRRPRYAYDNFDQVKEIVYAAFSHRRKKLVNSLSEADPVPATLRRFEASRLKALAERALAAMDLPPAIRPQGLTPAQFETFARMMIHSVPSDEGARPRRPGPRQGSLG